MSMLNLYKALMPITDSLEFDTVYVNATNIYVAVNMLYKTYTKYPTTITMIKENIATEPTVPTSVTVNFKSAYLDADNNQVAMDNLSSFPSSINSINRGDYVIVMAIENSEYTFDHWIDEDGETYTDKELEIIIPYDETISSLTYTAIYNKVVTSE